MLARVFGSVYLHGAHPNSFQTRCRLAQGTHTLIGPISKACTCTCSQLHLKEIQTDLSDNSDVRRMFDIHAYNTTLVWIPGQHGTAESEEMDISLVPQPVCTFAGYNRTLRSTTAEQRISIARVSVFWFSSIPTDPGIILVLARNNHICKP